MKPLAPRERLIVALDTPGVGKAGASSGVGEAAVFYKIGMELAYGGGLPSSPNWRARTSGCFSISSCTTFRIPSRGRPRRSPLGAGFLTVHAYPQTMRAAVAGAGDRECNCSPSRC